MADIAFGTRTALQQEQFIKQRVQAPQQSGRALRARQKQISEQMPELLTQRRFDAQMDVRKIQRETSGAQAGRIASQLMESENLGGIDFIQEKLGDVIEMGARAAGGEKGARMVARERLKFAQGDLTDMPVPGMNLLSYLGIGGKPDKETGESLKRGQMLLEVEAKRERREEQS